MAASDSTSRTNYARLGHVVQDIMPRILQTILLILVPPMTIEKECCKAMNTKNKKSRDKFILTAAERKKIYNAKTEGYGSFDVALLYKLFRNLQFDKPEHPYKPYIHPTNGYDYQNGPLDHHVTIGDDIERIRDMRNTILHKGNANVSAKEKKDYFTKFKEIAGRLQSWINVPNKPTHDFITDVEYLEHCDMDEEKAAAYAKTLELLAEREQDLDDRVTTIENKFKELGSASRDEIQFITPLRDKTCYEGETVSLECTVAGGKRPSKWYKDDNAIFSDRLRDESKDQTYKLTFLQATRKDAGPYKIKIGDEVLIVNLNVIEREPSLINLRNYQRELAVAALNQENTIICAGTNAGKTYVAFHIIEDHLLINPDGRVVFINKTNVLLEQQYQRACNTFSNLHFQKKLYKWQAGEDDDDKFLDIFSKTTLLFLTPKSLSNHLEENAKVKISIEDISLLILDECHHTQDRNPYNEVMSYYRMFKYGKNSRRLPQIVGLTASPGTNKAKDVSSAVDHIRKLMANLDVQKLSVVKEHKEELLQYSATPTKVSIKSSSRQSDPVKTILLDAIDFVEHIFNSQKVTQFQTTFFAETQQLFLKLRNPPRDKTELSYIQWMAESKGMIEHVLQKDNEVPRLLQTCIRHLELYAGCLEVNSLLEIEQVRNILTNGYGFLSAESQRANTYEEVKVVEKLKETLQKIITLGRQVEDNPDIKEIISRIDEQYQKFGEESRFIIFVKARATAEAIAERLPPYLRSTHLTGSNKPKEEGGRTKNEQLEVVDHFRNGNHLCIVATSVACEGLDIQQCNMMIRYKFVANEISSLQMRGRIRQKGGTEVIVATPKEFVFEELNIQRQFLMSQAVERVSNINPDTLARDITIAERLVYDSEEMERRKGKLQIGLQVRRHFSVICKICGLKIVDGGLLRHVNNKLFVVFDKGIFERIKRKPIPSNKVRTFDGITKRDKVHGGECGHNWGSVVIYQQCEFVSLSQDYITFLECSTNEVVPCKKWSELPFVISELSQQDIFQYNVNNIS